MDGDATCIINVQSPYLKIIAVKGDGFKAFLCFEIGALHDWYIAENSKIFKKAIDIGPGPHFDGYK